MDYKEKVIALLKSQELSKEQKEKIESIFPELKESEDERIRKELIQYLNDYPNLPNGHYCRDDFFAWLEKQKVTTPNKDIEKMRNAAINACKYMVDNFENSTKQYEDAIVWLENQSKQNPAEPNPAWNEEDKNMLKWVTGYLNNKMLNTSISEERTACKNAIAWFEKLKGEQKPADKVEPKFKVGDWIQIERGHVMKILDVDEEIPCYVILNWYGGQSVRSISDIDSISHLWTIQDAKDGDVLIDKSNNRECPFVFKKTKPSDIKTDYLNPLTVLGYCGIGGAGFTKSEGWGDTANCIYYPATKEQRDLLFQKMKEVGYEWDAEKKELKKIEQKKNMYNKLTDFESSLKHIMEEAIECGDTHNLKADADMLLSLVQNPAWNEEDERQWNNIWDVLDGRFELSEKGYKNAANWFLKIRKSLRPQNKWKPSDEQIIELRHVISGCSYDIEPLVELETKLKEL